MQLKAAGKIKSLQEGRQILYNSLEVERYEHMSEQRNAWETQYEKYLRIL